jgi:hypothetical protein
MGQVRGKSETRSEIALKTRYSQVPSRTEKKMVGWDGIEPPTPGFSVLCSTN